MYVYISICKVLRYLSYSCHIRAYKKIKYSFHMSYFNVSDIHFGISLFCMQAITAKRRNFLIEKTERQKTLKTKTEMYKENHRQAQRKIETKQRIAMKFEVKRLNCIRLVHKTRKTFKPKVLVDFQTPSAHRLCSSANQPT